MPISECDVDEIFIRSNLTKLLSISRCLMTETYWVQLKLTMLHGLMYNDNVCHGRWKIRRFDNTGNRKLLEIGCQSF